MCARRARWDSEPHDRRPHPPRPPPLRLPGRPSGAAACRARDGLAGRLVAGRPHRPALETARRRAPASRSPMSARPSVPPPVHPVEIGRPALAAVPAGAPATATVQARDLTRRYGEGDTAVHALRDVSVDIEPARLTAVMGPSGSGKSTLMHLLAGLDRPTSGEVTVAGVAVSDLDDTELTKLRRDHIGFIFQFFNLLPMLTAAENIVLPTRLAGGRPDPAWLDAVVESVGLANRLSHKPSEL